MPAPPQRTSETVSHSGFGLSSLDDHLTAPRGRGQLAGAPHTGSAGGAPCGDLVRISVVVEDDRVADVGFDAHGCAAARAAGSAVVELCRRRPLFEVARLSPKRISQELGGLSAQGMHAAALAADALHRALGAAARDGLPRFEASERRTLVAMSGGVDSAVAAQLALDAGHEVIGVTLELWADPAGDGSKSCCSPQAVTTARALAHAMGLPHITLDVRERFRSEVVDDFIGEQSQGRTPNPCVRCNGLVRFEVMLALAKRLGAARLATGHYARIAVDRGGPLVRAAVSEAKDQSYMLARLSADELRRLWFPLGQLQKPAVRELARSRGLPVADKADSQDLCFLAGVGAASFMRRHSDESERAGQIVDLAGKVVGSHPGQQRFTVGQRRGIGLAGPEPLYVIRKDARENRVTVGPRAALAQSRVVVDGVFLHRASREVDRVKLRYRSAPAACVVEGDHPAGPHASLTVALEQPAHGVAPGQTACLMRGDSVIGWGTIATARDKRLASAQAQRGAARVG